MLTRSMDQTPFFRMLRPPIALRPFMLELKRRYKLGLATNRSATVPALVEHLESWRRVRRGRERARQGSPQAGARHPAPVPHRAGVDATRAVYVGDSRIDREAAESAGMHFIGVGSRIEHHRTIATIADLQAALDQLTRDRK